jgi:hypothetical protein
MGNKIKKICNTIFNTYFCVTFIVVESPFGMKIELTEKENGCLRKVVEFFLSLSLSLTCVSQAGRVCSMSLKNGSEKSESSFVFVDDTCI